MDNTINNYLRVHRRKAGLSQHELGQLIGYHRSWQISRHERSETLPPLLIALAYEAVFGVAVSAIFVELHATVSQTVEQRLAEFEGELRGSHGTRGEMTRKMRWLKQRRASS
jgi:DNA-binding XRE family transcriptional regulator